MTTFTINETNEIVAFATPEEASAAATTPFDSFTSEQELAGLAAGWPAERLLAILNSLPGEKPAKKLKDPKTAVARIWGRIQALGEAAQPEVEAAKPKAGKKAKGGARAAKGAPAKGKVAKQATPAKKAPRAKKAAKESGEPKAARTGTKSEEVIAMLKRKGGATMAEIMAHTCWQKHTTRGWVSGFLGKKMGIAVESFKSDKGERTYRIK
jgi:hypothetical protein